MKAALILAGGKAVRFHGERKALVILGGKPLIQWVIEAVDQCVDEIFISGDSNLAHFGYPVIEDELSDLGPLVGFNAGFSVIESEYTFVTACDMPFISPKVVAYLFEKGEGYSCSLPRKGRYTEPLCCVYRTKDVRACCTSVIRKGKRRIWDLIQCLPNPKYVSYEDIRRMDPHLFSFRNINTEEDLEHTERLLTELKERVP